MNDPRIVITTAKTAIDVLELAALHAESRWHWRQINQLAANLVRSLRDVQANEAIVPSFRTDARQDADSLAEIMHRSCAKIEEFDSQPPVVVL